MNEAPPTAEEIAHWRSFVGRTETRRQWLDEACLVRFAAAVGAELDIGPRLPPMAHWAYFLEVAPSSQLGSDGHPVRSNGLLPPVRLPRRMFAASSITFLEPLRLSQPASLTLTVADVTHKPGKSGDLILVDVDRILEQESRTLIVERQTIVYRAAQTAPMPAVTPSPEALVPAAGAEVWTPRAVDLFRFSAVTFNSHRIHYDLPYTQAEEGYPGLVVHGPLTAARLYAFACARTGLGDAPHRFEFRAQAPLFVGQPIRLEGAAEREDVRAVRCDGVVSMSGRIGAVAR